MECQFYGWKKIVITVRIGLIIYMKAANQNYKAHMSHALLTHAVSMVVQKCTQPAATSPDAACAKAHKNDSSGMSVTSNTSANTDNSTNSNDMLAFLDKFNNAYSSTYDADIDDEPPRPYG